MSNYYRNEYLFSEIYLEEITQLDEDAGVLASLTTLKEYRDWAKTHTLQEWKDTFVHEVLSALRFSFKAEDDHITLLYPFGMIDQPISVCYILLPGENLDNTTLGRNWAEKIIRNLRQRNLNWGVLTNGEQWRIYHLDEPTPYETYLEIDLAAIFADSAAHAYQIFYKFLQAKNFVEADQGQSRFDLFKAESQAKIDYIEDELANALKQKEEGGQGVLSNLCMGYVQYLKSQGEPDLDDEALRRKIYHGAMLYMFRLLFLLYADARNLLSADNRQLLAEIRQKSRSLTHGGGSAVAGFELWQKLETIFVDIDQTYDGGLFNPYESEFTRFIEETRIADSYLAPALYHLVYYHERSGEERLISYRDMSVRHLGTLYEGLLEHKLFIAKEDTEVHITKDIVQFIPASQGGKIIAGRYVPAGQVYFGSDRTERKETGSYYTPEYIVEYMVRSTIGEKLVELGHKFQTEQQSLLDAYSRAIDNKERQGLKQLLEDKLNEFLRNEVLKLSVLDMAMGSGHFLVNGTNQIANFITEFPNGFDLIGETETSTSHWRRWVVENCIYGVDVNPLAVELAKLSVWILAMVKDQPLSFLNHHLKVGDSLLGVKLEDIGTYPGGKIRDKQMSFFDNNLNFKTDVRKVVENYNRIVTLNSASLEDITQKKVWLDEINELLDTYVAICDFHTDVCIKNDVSELEYRTAVNESYLGRDLSIKHDNYFHWSLEFPEVLILSSGFDVVIGNPPYLGQKGHKEVFWELQKGPRTKQFHQRRMDLFYFFFHLGIDITNKGGFIAFITTNYYLTATYSDKLRQQIFQETSIRKLINFNEFKLFESALGQHSLITVLEKSKNDNLIANTAITRRIGVADTPTLKEILNGVDSETSYYRQSQSSLFEPETLYIRIEPDLSNHDRTKKQVNIFTILEKIKTLGEPLSTYCNIEQGIVSGADKVTRSLITKYPQIAIKEGEGIFILTNKEVQSLNLTAKEEIYIKKTYKSSRIERWFVNVDDEINVIYIKSTGKYFDIGENLRKHLDKYKLILINRNVRHGTITEEDYDDFLKGKKNVSYIMNASSMKAGNYYCISYSRRGKNTFEVEKIVNPRRSKTNVFALENDGYYEQSDIVITTLKPKFKSSVNIRYLLALLSSKLYYQWLYHKGKRKGETLELFQRPLGEVPIRVIPLSNQESFIDLTNQIISVKKSNPQTNVSELEERIDQMVYELFDLTDEEISIVEGQD